MKNGDALIDITEKIRDACDKGFYTCGGFLDFKKAFDTVSHDILLKKLVRYGIRSQANNWFKLYFIHSVQFISVNRFNSLTVFHKGQSYLRCCLLYSLLTCANQLNTVKCYTLQTTQIFSTLMNPRKKVNKHINHDLYLIVQWIRSTKISLNTDKADLVIFSPMRKQITKHLNFRISGQNIEISNRETVIVIDILESK